ncbi:diguanylate cyclase/phosphodiesterase [Novosphingobium sp. PhB165]|uniref:EAL domain-containing protein n=1 Tax=Novosphingobium sp. PhB165 TaxID=2485105 RepID=UPI001043BC13|nr:EAL domain-containing protein [Novosphingobium sp. PhB165]TCM20755.1 diguanylate cyclase/phosphodiesterase [Novosphingobium sp. PhB165]
MLLILQCIRDRHDFPLVLLAALVCALTAIGTVRLSRQIRWAHGREKTAWLATTGIVAGLGIWATHFIAMLGYDPGFVFGYDFAETAASLAIVLGTSVAALLLAARFDSKTGSFCSALLMGGGVAAMHYLGMAALEMPAIIRWDLGYVVVSVVLAIAPFTLAIPLALRGQSAGTGAAAAMLMAFAVVLLHFTGMTAISLIPSRADFSSDTMMSPRAMSLWVFVAAFSTLAIAATAAAISRRAEIMMRRNERLNNERLELVGRRLDLALENMHQGLCLFGADGQLVLWNQRFLEMYRLAPGDIRLGMTMRDIAQAAIGNRAPPAEIERRVMRVLNNLDAALESHGRAPDVSEYDDFVVSVRSRPLPDGGWVSTFDDITEQRRTEARIEHLALHDGLTGLPNRSKFNDLMDRAIDIAAHSGARLGVVVLDLDGFKEINDSRGHAAGDEALKAVAASLREAMLEGQNVARLGGDEFAATVLFRENHELADFVDRISTCFNGPSGSGAGDFVVKASFGVAAYPEDGLDREQLCNNADLAMYRAKENLGERICYYEKGMDESARYRRQIAADLRGAAERGELIILYQAQRTLKDGCISGYEALLRWHHPARGLVTPCEFIPIAEETGEIFAIGEWVLRQACREAARWPEHHMVAVNLSAVQLGLPNLPEIIAGILVETGLPPRRLELEITETAIIGDKARALHILRKLKAMGVSIAIDDFGTGYSSLDTLNSFPFDKIKIDKSFVTGSEDRPQARAIIRAVLALGRSLDVPVLAEGVETHLHVDLLQAEGCDQVQGFLFGRPQCAPSLMAAAGMEVDGASAGSAAAHMLHSAGSTPS